VPVHADVFAMTVFLCDGFFRLTESSQEAGRGRAVHFFHILRQLPMDAQMAVCNRLEGRVSNVISVRESERALKELARAEQAS